MIVYNYCISVTLLVKILYCVRVLLNSIGTGRTFISVKNWIIKTFELIYTFHLSTWLEFYLFIVLCIFQDNIVLNCMLSTKIAVA